MKPENIQAAINLNTVLESVENAQNEIERFLNRNPVDVHGWDTSEDGRLKSVYSLFLSEHQDGSGGIVDLTNCGIGVAVVEFISTELAKRRTETLEKIKAL